MKIQQLKNMATRLKSEINVSQGKISHTKLMELIAKSLGFHDYNGCKATLEKPESEKPYTEYFISFHTDRNIFEKVWKLTEHTYFGQSDIHVSVQYGEGLQIVSFHGENNVDFLKNELKDVSEFCNRQNIRMVMTIRSCEHIDFSYDAWLEKKVEESLSGKKISPEDAKAILGFDPEDFRRK